MTGDSPVNPAFSLVVMEPGSDWPGQVDDSATLVALCQEEEELLRNTQARLTFFAEHDQRLSVAVLACNGQTEGNAAERRARLARVLLEAVANTTCGRLIVSASSAASHALREQLFALVEALTAALRGTTASVSLRFAT